jgi:hypothetical protein
MEMTEQRMIETDMGMGSPGLPALVGLVGAEQVQ